MKTKDKLLELLKSHFQNWVSGEALSRELDISRNSVSKHIKTLRQQGYEIESVTGKGYRLQQLTQALFPEEIHQQLTTRILGQQTIHYFQEIDSTNLKAKELAAAGAPEGTVVLAESQTMGRGRKGRNWFSPPGTGVYISLILRPRCTPDKATRLTFLTAVAATLALQKMSGVDVRIKWPNDLLIGQRKLAGILTEISTDTEAINYAVVGLGININAPQKGFNEAVKSIAISLEEASGQTHTRLDFVRFYLAEFEQYYHKILNDQFAEILTLWKKHSNIIGKTVRVEMIQKTIQGIAVDIEVDGVLQVRDQNNTIHRIYSGDIHILP